MSKFNKIKVILGIAALAALSAGIAACAEQSDIKKYQQQGYDVKVTFDASGGQFLGRQGISITKMYKSENYMENGTAKIKITDPAENPAHIPTKSSPMSFYAGWYKTREIRKNAEGKPVDYWGRALVYDEDEITYYVENAKDDKGNPTKLVSTPEYDYSDYWDFENDVITVEEGSGTTEITLYAGWVPNFSFDYYYQNDSGEWVLYGTTDFDYKAATTESSMADYDMLYVPDWSDGAMSHSHTRSDGTSFEFADINKSTTVNLNGASYTFEAAYLDEACTQRIESELKHGGTLDVKTHTPTNAIRNIYVKYKKYRQYKIETAQQLIKYADPTARYEIMADLDFTDLSWPTVFSTGTFTGEIVSAEGHSYKIKNATATVSGANVQYGGLFGSIASGAKIKNVAFENAVVDFATLSRAGFNIGLFSGDINANAEISGVSVGGRVQVGAIGVPASYEFNLLANGNVSGLTNSGIGLRIYGEDYFVYIRYSINAEKVTVASDGDVTLVGEEVRVEDLNKKYFDIDINMEAQ